MRNLSGLTLAAVTGLFALGCTAPAPEDTSQADLAAFDDLREREMAAFSAGDMETLREVFASDAALLPPNEPGFQGTDNMESWLAAMQEQVSLEAAYTDSDVTLAGDWAFERVAFTLTLTPRAGGEAVQETGKGVHVYQRQADGTWKIVLDAWNMDSPPAAEGDGGGDAGGE